MESPIVEKLRNPISTKNRTKTEMILISPRILKSASKQIMHQKKSYQQFNHSKKANNQFSSDYSEEKPRNRKDSDSFNEDDYTVG